MRYAVLSLITLLWVGTPAARAQEFGVAGELERTASTTPEEKLSYAAEGAEEMQAVVRSLERMLEGTRREADVDRLQCLNARLTAARALASVSEKATEAMKVALDGSEAERANHEFRKIAVARTKVGQLEVEAERCTQDEGVTSGDTRVTVNGEDVGDEDDTKKAEFDAFSLGYDPPEESPFI